MFSLSSRWLVFSILLLGQSSPTLAAGGTSLAPCTQAQLPWAFNSLNQSPCLVAADLGAVCSSTGTYTVPALGAGQFYTPSTADTHCECSTVTYSLLAACSLCQGQTPSTWTFYDENCTSISPSVFPLPIPSGVTVPHWAFQDVNSSGNFNATLAQADGDSPESTAPAPSSTSTSSSSSTSSQSSSSSGSSGGSSSGHKSNTGAIAGGVVGGVVALLLIGLLAFFFMRKRRGSQADRVAPGAYENAAIDGPIHTPDTAVGSYGNMSQKPYDPSDPSTFPSSAMSYGTSNNAAYSHGYNSSQQAIYDSSGPTGDYNGSFTNSATHSPSPAPPANAPGRHLGYSGVAEL
ncbi:hypothetical protein SISNIDRAFT_451821 [Sistotremastrum niveocremeum HHB9708]|uniref:Mid2 domain-containing protein n=1 Tax=Sistotremastrum niveocremeum HHB9708 TaxID=1314777 RepID=A0A164XMW4_9AGAM|nr:hypothetical protein SISNIDRAFT_451821 [Sistotremastrum niveocremeum HHB9708]